MGTAQKLPRWKRRTPEQIEANKAAQKRFRQRKKAKLQTVSQNVEDLTHQMQAWFRSSFLPLCRCV
jgi:hypothetical protein